MAGQKSLIANVSLLSDIDTSQRNPLGLRVQDDQGNEYIYLVGVASTAAGDFVMFGGNLTYVTSRLLNDAGAAVAGMVGVAMAAIVASQFGWYQIYGLTTAIANIATTASVSFNLYRTGTAGRAAVTAVAKDAVFGAVTAAASVSNVGQAFLSYPHVTDNSTL